MFYNVWICFIIINSNSVPLYFSVTLKALQHPVFSLQGMWDYVLIMGPTAFIAPCKGLQGAVVQYADNQTRNIARYVKVYQTERFFTLTAAMSSLFALASTMHALYVVSASLACRQTKQNY